MQPILKKFAGPQPLLNKWAEPIYGLMRIVVGFLFLCHGLQKIFGMFGMPGRAQGLFLAAGIIECVCGALILIGLLGSLAALIASGEMAVAYFLAHAHGGVLPIVNHGELAVLYCFIFLYIAARGSGSLSVDALWKRG
jgi:putative oxidoreductase